MAYQYDENQGFRPEGTPPPPPPRKNGVEKNNNDLGSWIFIIVMLSVAWPVGLILLISKLSDSSGRKNRAPRQASAQAQPKVQQTMQQVTKTPVYTDKSAKTMKTIGAVLGILGCLALFSAVGENLSYAVQYSEWWFFLRQLFYPVGMLASGAALLLGSGGLKRRQRRYATYLRTAGQKPAVPLAHLCGGRVGAAAGEGPGHHAGKGPVGRERLYRQGQRDAVSLSGGGQRLFHRGQRRQAAPGSPRPCGGL